MISALRHIVFLLAFGASIAAAHAEDTLSIVAENNWYPYAAERNGVPEGFAVDLVRAAFHAAGRDINLASQPYARCLEEVAEGRQLGCFDTIREPANEARFLFHQVPLFSATIVIIAPLDATALDLTEADLRGQKVAVTNGYTYGEQFQSDSMIRKVAVTSDISVLRVVGLKRVPYGVIYDKVMASLISEHAGELAGKVKIVGVLTKPDLYVSFSKKRPESAAAMATLDRGLMIIKANGTYAAIEQKWAARFAVAGTAN